PGLVSPSLLSYLSPQAPMALLTEIPMQGPISITKFQKTAQMTCEIQKLESGFDGTIIHWYQQKEGKAPERLLLFTGGETSVEGGFQAHRYKVEKDPGQNRCVLIIKDVIPDDTATYYCAYWAKYLGDGNDMPTTA
uniref:Ig-like domain-containing protein n=1 Tax=Buteo japonicus TaxID=224669 RepID=A0A8C0AVW6_9AVES